MLVTSQEKIQEKERETKKREGGERVKHQSSQKPLRKLPFLYKGGGKIRGLMRPGLVKKGGRKCGRS